MRRTQIKIFTMKKELIPIVGLWYLNEEGKAHYALYQLVWLCIIGIGFAMLARMVLIN